MTNTNTNASKLNPSEEEQQQEFIINTNAYGEENKGTNKKGQGDPSILLPTKKKGKKRKKGGKWVTPKVNHWIYITGLPSTVTCREIATFCGKCGLIEENAKSCDPRIKLYQDKSGKIKGDASVCFVKEISVGLAIQLLDQSLFLNTNSMIHVSVAEFKQKGETFIERKRIKRDQRDKIRKKQQQQSLGWNDGQVGMEIMVLKNMFTTQEATTEGESFAEELKKDVFEECSTFGPVEKVNRRRRILV